MIMPSVLTANETVSQKVPPRPETKAAVVAEAEAPKKPRKTAAWQKKADEAAKDEPLVIVQTQK